MLEHHFNMNDPEFIRDPYPLLAEFRKTKPLFYDPQWKQIYVTRYDDIASILKDRRLGRTLNHILPPEAVHAKRSDSRLSAFHRYNDQHMLDSEPPKHSRMKAVALKAFTPQRVEAMRDHIQSVGDRLLDAHSGRHSMDLRADFAEPLPVIVIGELLSIPERDWHKLRPWTSAIVRMYELGYSDGEIGAANTAAQEFMDYMRNLVFERKDKPTNDLISALMQLDDHGERLTEDEIVANCILLLIGGHETTVNSILSGMVALQRNPSQMSLLLQEARTNLVSTSPLFRTAVEEMLRFDTPSPLFERYVVEDFDYQGHHLTQGTELALILASGNRDSEHFENADCFDITRKNNAHLTFGLGIHYCLGAPLARLEMQVAFHTLLRRLPNIQVTIQQPEYSGFVLRGIKSLPVIF